MAYSNTAKETINERVEALLSKMTLKEKVGQVNQKLYGWEVYRKTDTGYELTEKFKEHVERWDGIGVLYGLFRSDPWSAVHFENGITEDVSADVANLIQQYVKEHTRLGIPVLLSEECSHGHQGLDSMITPVNLGIGATWNPELHEKLMAAVAEEVRAKGAHLALVSTLDILRDPRWGRSEECFSEDPYLASQLTEAVVKGMQGEPGDFIPEGKLTAVLKHFAAQGNGTGGKNAAPASIGERELREIHLPPMISAIQSGALACMAAYNEIDGIPCHANGYLLNQILREEFGFKGAVMADGCALDNLVALTQSREKAAALALENGVDISLWDDVYTTLETAVETGLVSEEKLNDAVRRVLTLKFKMGLFDRPYVEADPMKGKEQAEKINLESARQSIVLLKNDGILPLKKDIKKIAVIGPNADAIYNQLGDYTPFQREDRVITVRKGITSLASEADVVYEKGCGIRSGDRDGIEKAVHLAGSSDVAIVVLGGSSARKFDAQFDLNGAVVNTTGEEEMDCGENVDVANLELGGLQLQLLQKVMETGTPVIVVLIQGRPHAIPWIAEHAPAILSAWYPGQMGGQAIAEVLFGEVNPSGRLPVSIPRSSMQLPVFYNYKDGGYKKDYFDQSGNALYPFGFGLSYTEFRYENLRVTRKTITADQLLAGEKFSITVDVTNIGDRDGYDVIQLYLKGKGLSITRRVKELKGFRKVWLAAGETKEVMLELGAEELQVFSSQNTYKVEQGWVEIEVGNPVDSLSAVLTIG
ncbi:glycoside hydrolase family 3 C-terminal domain-containing protein [Neobacillus drentensis]|uniref:glycoside hydrolase family 3 N-terminal domain-containing protein n=1 Tax=Neobacillus drentensis TaxID=220684 RepID=UPI001F353756|nr:glycoside hydrolase family 3 N-terminal domain-containing protein [Neobacillus drentensis]ULT56691.1 glycoside hydrolase family 3 C-terminal domain-containing protein [Neobacillus drentensis]